MEIVQLSSIITKVVSNISGVLKEVIDTSEVILIVNSTSFLSPAIAFNSTIYVEEI